MTKKLRRKSVILALSALLLLLTVIDTSANLLNFYYLVEDGDSVIEMMLDNREFSNLRKKKHEKPLPTGMSKEVPFETRYFTVKFDTDGNTVDINTDSIATVDEDAAMDYVQEALSQNKSRGFVDVYRYQCRDEEDGGTTVFFLDMGRKLDIYYQFVFTSIGVSLLGFVAISVVVVILSGRIVRPITESYEKQRRFIADAGHEIKTPLTIINANVDVLEMDYGENESLHDIVQQTQRLRSLTEELIFLTRMEDGQDNQQKIEFPVSDIVSEAAAPFRVPAIRQKKVLQCEVQPMLTLCGYEKSVFRLVNILLDNAIKYSPADTVVKLSLTKQAHALALTVENKTVTKMDKKQLAHVFERFYRTDASRNSQTGGHGIGLSVAKAIVDSHGGRITAAAPTEDSFVITAIFPQ